MQEQNNKMRKLHTIACFALIAAYLAGFVLMFLDMMSQGLALWVLSTFGGIAILYFKRKQDEAEELLRKQEEEASAGEE